jgi:hypothetical protein
MVTRTTNNRNWMIGNRQQRMARARTIQQLCMVWSICCPQGTGKLLECCVTVCDVEP